MREQVSELGQRLAGVEQELQAARAQAEQLQKDNKALSMDKKVRPLHAT